jgi:hypothetical protein
MAAPSHQSPTSILTRLLSHSLRQIACERSTHSLCSTDHVTLLVQIQKSTSSIVNLLCCNPNLFLTVSSIRYGDISIAHPPPDSAPVRSDLHLVVPHIASGVEICLFTSSSAPNSEQFQFASKEGCSNWCRLDGCLVCCALRRTWL